ncbi:MAG: tRNA-dihydrouridine synthase family protein [Candidatus Aureabacteria bacterium]|nr:tRNA-dihydrouridine synthase family protein [Candidatus Auribacterota bacterium]
MRRCDRFIAALALAAVFLCAIVCCVSDLAFRTIARSFGCGLAFAEMISANGLVHGNKKTEKLLSTSPADRPLGIQLAGADPGTIGRAVEKLRGRSFDLLDINAACPVRKVVRRGEGASLLKEPACLAAILAEAVKRATVPVTVKLRTGWDHTSRNAREIGRLAEDAGVAAIFIHGRTRAQGYSGDVDYAAIREVKNAVRVPVIASGDGLSPRLVTF